VKPCYIHSAVSISAQESLDPTLFLNPVISYDQPVINAIVPSVKEFISPGAARRMATGVKMGVVAANLALRQANIDQPDAIITGTGMGCVRDSEKFVSAIIDNEEEFLTPTSFIQSTHNTVGAQIALGLGCKAYNFTYVHSAISFESCLLDAQMMFEEQEANQILVGGVDEHGAHTNRLHQLIGHLKNTVPSTADILTHPSPGAVFGEGASFFVLSDQASENALAQLVGVATYSQRTTEELPNSITRFLHAHDTDLTNVDAVVLGNNGDSNFDSIYANLQKGLFGALPQVGYKHLSGEFMTASSFGFWLATELFRSQTIPAACQLNSISPNKIKTVLLYNQYRGENHSLVLLRGK